MSYEGIITIEPGKRGGQPCTRGMRMTVYDVLGPFPGNLFTGLGARTIEGLRFLGALA